MRSAAASSRAVLVTRADVVVGERVARVDLDEVVDEQHRDDACGVDRCVAVRREHDRHQREVPGVLRRVLAAFAAADGVAAEHRLERVDLQDEREPVVEIAHPSSTSHSNGVPSSACCISDVTRLSWSNIRITPKTMSTTAAVPTSSGK